MSTPTNTNAAPSYSNEIRRVLTEADGPLTSREIFNLSERFETTTQISATIFALRQAGEIETDEQRRHSLKPSAPGNGSAPAAAKSQVATPKKKETKSPRAPVTPVGKPPTLETKETARLVMDEIEEAAISSKAVLERYIAGLGDPVLTALVRAAGDARDAADAYARRVRGA